MSQDPNWLKALTTFGISREKIGEYRSVYDLFDDPRDADYVYGWYQGLRGEFRSANASDTETNKYRRMGYEDCRSEMESKDG